MANVYHILQYAFRYHIEGCTQFNGSYQLLRRNPYALILCHHGANQQVSGGISDNTKIMCRKDGWQKKMTKMDILIPAFGFIHCPYTSSFQQPARQANIDSGNKNGHLKSSDVFRCSHVIIRVVTSSSQRSSQEVTTGCQGHLNCILVVPWVVKVSSGVVTLVVRRHSPHHHLGSLVILVAT